MRDTLLRIYHETLRRCAPEKLTARIELSEVDAPVDVVAIGKCAAGLFDGVAARIAWERGIVAIPKGYPAPRTNVEIVEGTHPHITPESFAAGARVAEFVRSAKRPILFLISGGSSASLEQPLAPWFEEDDVAEANELLLRSGMAIEKMNVVRKHLSAIKGGRLGALASNGAITWIYSDVAAGREEHVASGPTLPDPTTNHDAAAILAPFSKPLAARLLQKGLPDTPKAAASPHRVIADNRIFVHTAAEISGFAMVREELDEDVESVARSLHAQLMSSEAFVAGGEPTVVVRGAGRGGRCSELALRFARLCAREKTAGVYALFASSDGLDGNSGCAGFTLAVEAAIGIDETAIDEALSRSNSYELAARIGQPILIPPTGNNLRDVFIVARGSHVTG